MRCCGSISKIAPNFLWADWPSATTTLQLATDTRTTQQLESNLSSNLLLSLVKSSRSQSKSTMRNQARQSPINNSNNAAKGRGMLPWLVALVMMCMATSNAFVATVVPPVLPLQKQSHCHSLLYATVGIFFGTSVRLTAFNFFLKSECND